MNHTGRLPRHFRVLLPGALGTLFFLLLSGQQACVPQDNDGDGWVAGEGNLADCNDEDPTIHPGAEEVCDNVDHDCDMALFPCTRTVTFDDPADAALFTLERSGDTNPCQDQGVSGGTLQVSCADNRDAVYWFDMDIVSAAHVEMKVKIATDAWNDSGPRIGLDFGEGFHPWGPAPGYAFFLSDPLDSQQGNRCSFGDTCPSITKDHAEILDLSNTRTYPGKTYHLLVDLSDGGEAFELSFDQTTLSLSSEDAEVRSGQVGLHCSEGNCAFDDFTLTVE